MVDDVVHRGIGAMFEDQSGPDTFTSAILRTLHCTTV